MVSKFTASLALATAIVATSPAWAASTVAPSTASTPRSHTKLNADPAVRIGVLDNGLRYYVMHNETPTGAISLRLAVKTGSYEEADAERGFAHFIEHLAFRSSRTAPEGGLDRLFAPKGIEFGQDLNAFTDRDATTFKLDLPKGDPELIKSGIGWLRDVADGVNFTDAAVSKERGVVLAEMEARTSLAAKAGDAVARFQAEDQRFTARDPIGLVETLNAATAQGLSRFHDRWYRPDNAILVIVGDLPLNELEGLVKSNFASWKSVGPAPARAPVWKPRQDRPQEAFVLAGATLAEVTTVCRTQAKDLPAETEIAKLRVDMTSAVALAVLNSRLAERASQSDSGILESHVSRSDIQGSSLVCLGVAPLVGKWSQALRSAEAELNTYLKDGPSEIEVETAVDKIRDGLRGGVLSASSRTTKAIADDLLDEGINGDTPGAPLDDIYHFDLAVEDLTPADVSKRFAKLWSGGGPLLSAAGPAPPTRAELMAAWSQGGAAQAAPLKAKAASVSWAYSSFGKPGKVIERTRIDPPGFDRFIFDNGLILNFKVANGGTNQVMTSVSFGEGRHDIDKADLFVAGLASSALISGGLGKHDIGEIQSIFGDMKNWSFDISIGDSATVITNTTYKDSLQSELQILAAYMSDPGFRPEFDQRLASAIDQVFRYNDENPQLALGLAMTNAINPSLSVIFPDRATAAKATSKDMERVLKAQLTQQPLELSIVGDLEEDAVIKMVAATFGALPRRSDLPASNVDPGFELYPREVPPPVYTTHKGAKDKAVAALEWPLYVANPERRREEYALKVLSSVFDTALRQRIREEMGKTYSPSVSLLSPDYGDQATIRVVIDSAPSDIEALVEESKLVASRLSLGDVPHELIEGARQPMLASIRANHGSLRWWLSAMMVSQRIPYATTDVVEAEHILSDLSDEEIITAAAKWLSRPPFIGIATPTPKPESGDRP